MNWVDILVIILFILVIIGGLKEGAVKHFFSLVITVISIPLAGLSYRVVATVLSFLPGTNWENFFGFFITLAVISVILHIVLFIPRKTIQKMWKKGILFRLLGAGFNLLGAMIGLAVFALVLEAFPIITWISENVARSAIMSWLPDAFGFVQAMLPEIFHRAATTVFFLS